MMIDMNAVEIQEALLARRVRRVLSASDRRAFSGQRVCITGGGGSIGGELARQIAACRPSALLLIDQSEYNLFRIESQIAERWPMVPVQAVLGDVTRIRSIHVACRAARPHVIYHAAAYKHVTMTERAVCAAVEANVFGSVNAARVARDCGARFVLISSDKAAHAKSVMGATKRLAELATVSRVTRRGWGPAQEKSPFRPVVVRFGNVLGSSGSLLEIVLDRLRRRQPIPITHPEATRYFMTASEAASLVMKADLVGQAGETYWLDMGKPVRIVDLVQRTIALAVESGLRPVPVNIVGLRPGEKLREELAEQGIELQRTGHTGIWMARQPAVDTRRVRRLLRALRDDLRRADALGALEDLCAAVPEFEASRDAWAAAAVSAVGSDARVYFPIPATRTA